VFNVGNSSNHVLLSKDPKLGISWRMTVP